MTELPFDRDAERRLIAAVSAEPDLFAHAAGLAPADFYDVGARAAWEKLAPTIRAGGVVQAADYAEFFGVEWVTPLPQFVADDARRVAEKAYHRAAIGKAQEIAKAALAGDTLAVERLTAEAAALRHAAQADTLRPAPDIAAELWDEIVNHAALAGRLVPTGLRPLDLSIGGGLERGTSNVIMARPSMGKTAILAQISDLASEAGLVVAVFSLEMTERQWLRRIACRRAKVSWLAFKQNNATFEQERAVLDWTEALGQRGTLFIDDKPKSSADTWADCERLQRRLGRLDLVIGDHLRLFSDRDEREDKRLGAITWNFKQMCKALDTVGLFAAQLNRGVEGQSDRRPDLNHLRDSGQIEENIDTCWALYRDSYYSENRDDHTAELIARKARDGERNSRVRMVFLEDYMSFEPLAVGVNGNGRTKNTPAPLAAHFAAPP